MSKTRYSLPENTNPTSVGIQLKNAYKRHRPNQQRLDFFILYDYFGKHAPIDQQVALLIFELELIEQNYKMIAPEEKKGWLYNTGSQVYTELHNLLGDISVEERLIKINQLRQYVAENVSTDTVKSVTWPSQSHLINNIDAVIKNIIKVKEKARISRLLHTMPDLMALKNNIQAIYAGYEDAKANRYFKETPARVTALSFLDCVAATSDEMYGSTYRGKSRDDNEKDTSYMKAYNIYRGMVLHVLLQIKDEYNLLSPHRSALYRECLASLGGISLKEITNQEKIDWLQALSNHIEAVQEDNRESCVKWKNHKFLDLTVEKFKIETRIFNLKKEIEQPSFLKRTAKSATSSAATYAFQRAAVGYIAEYAIIPTAAAAIAGAVAGPVGVMVGGFVGPFIANRIGRLVTEKLIPAAVGNACATILDRIACTMGNAAANTAFSLFSISANGVERLLGYYKENINDNFEVEWINTLLELPDETLSAIDKQKIRKICGLPNPQLSKSNGKMLTLFSSMAICEDYQGEKPAAVVSVASS